MSNKLARMTGYLYVIIVTHLCGGRKKKKKAQHGWLTTKVTDWYGSSGQRSNVPSLPMFLTPDVPVVPLATFAPSYLRGASEFPSLRFNQGLRTVYMFTPDLKMEFAFGPRG